MRVQADPNAEMDSVPQLVPPADAVKHTGPVPVAETVHANVVLVPGASVSGPEGTGTPTTATSTPGLIPSTGTMPSTSAAPVLLTVNRTLKVCPSDTSPITEADPERAPGGTTATAEDVSDPVESDAPVFPSTPVTVAVNRRVPDTGAR